MRSPIQILLGLAIFCGIAYISSHHPPGYREKAEARLASSSSPPSSARTPNGASFAEVNGQIGCTSKYSDQKKEDIFVTRYRDRQFSWTGTVEEASTQKVSVKLNPNTFSYDLDVALAEGQSAYDILKEQTITVRFVLKPYGGCFLPYSGYDGEIIGHSA
jgi:hypothetical protein